MTQKKILIILITLIVLYPNLVFAKISYNVGTTLSFLNISDKYKFSHQNEQFQLTNLNIGLNYNYNKNPIIFSLATNRLLNRPSIREVVDSKNNKFINKTKTIADTIIISYVYKNTSTGLFISNVNLQKSIFYKGNLAGHKINNIIITGLNINYFFVSKYYTSLSILAPKKEIGLNSGLILGLNYQF